MPAPWTADDDLRFALMMGLRKGLNGIRGARRTFSEDEQQRIAAAILEHLRLANYTVTPGAPAQGHAHLMPVYGSKPEGEPE